MLTIVEPKKLITKLWSYQPIRDSIPYRMMRYVLRVDYQGRVLLHNVVTGHLVILEKEEEAFFSGIPCMYHPFMNQLIKSHYLVPEDYNEDQQVIDLRKVLQKLNAPLLEKKITKYTILPTTACNARCYYCYEQGITKDVMTEQTADEVVRFICNSSMGKDVRIRWFGGEPTLAVNRISQICAGLIKFGTKYSSNMITNGYLFDQEMVEKAVELWHLDSVKISFDGVGKTHNRIKAFKDVSDDPYERIMRNIGFFLKRDVNVSVFMNFDKTNYSEFYDLLSELESRFGISSHLRIQSHQLMLENLGSNDESSQCSEYWYQEKIHELNEAARRKGFLSAHYDLPSLEYRWCEAAADNTVTILPDGNLVRCPEKLSDDQIIGNLKCGMVDSSLCAWKKFDSHLRCCNCVLFPDCMKIHNCMSTNKCYTKQEKMSQYLNNIERLAQAFS